MTNEELVELIQRNLDIKENMGLLYQQNRGYIYKLALPYASFCDVEDLMQEAYFGLHTAVEKYNINTDVRFMTYAAYWIKQKLNRYAYRNTHTQRVPEYLVKLMSDYHKYRNTYRATNDGKEPSSQLYMLNLGLSEKQFDNLVKTIKASSCASLDSLLPGAEQTTILDTLGDNYNLENDVVERLGVQQAYSELWGCVNKLDTKQCDVIKKHYKGNMSLTDIARNEGVSRERVRQIEAKAMRCLQKDNQVTKIGKILGYDCYQAFNYSLDRFNNTWTSSTEYIALKRMKSKARFY